MPRRSEDSDGPLTTDPSNQQEAVAQPSHLEYITITDRPAAAKAAYSRVVRSQAMQSFLRTKRENLTSISKKTKQAPSTVAQPTAQALYSRFRLPTRPRKSTKKDATSKAQHKLDGRKPKHDEPKLELIDSSLNEYSSLPIQITQEMRRLLYHYNTSYTINSFALNPEGTWISFSFMDPALLHATLGLVALHRDLLTRHEHSTDSLMHKGHAIQAINHRLQYGQSASDENLAIVAVLIKFEILHGTLETSKPHMLGLLEMLRIRGGLSHLAHNQVLLRVLTWVDLLYAARWGTKPCVVPMHLHKGPLAAIVNGIMFKYTLPTAQDIEGSSRMLSINEQIDLDVLETLQGISAAKAKASNLRLEERKVASHVIYALNHRLLMDLSDSGSLVTSTLYRAFWVAAVIYLHLIIRDIPQSAKLHGPIVDKLELFMESARSSNLVQGHTLNIGIWIAFLGAAATPPEETAGYFTILLALMLKAIGIQNKDQLRKCLREIVWEGDSCDHYLTVVWAQINAVYKSRQLE